jgi:hypothetical protein
MVAAGYDHTAGLKADGTAVAAGRYSEGQCNVGGWTDITQITAGKLHTVGLKSDDTVVAVGDNYRGQCNVGGWTNITQVAAVSCHTVGLKSDGTVVATPITDICRPDYDYGQCNVGGWTNITQVAAGSWHTAELKEDGTVVAAGPGAEVARWNLVFVEGDPRDGQVAVKAGDWIKYDYDYAGWPAGGLYLEWMKLEFLSVEGTTADMQATVHMSDGTEQSSTMTVDLGEGGGEALGLSGFVIPRNLTTGDYFYMDWFWQCSDTRRNYKNLCGSKQSSSPYKLFAVDTISR